MTCGDAEWINDCFPNSIIDPGSCVIVFPEICSFPASVGLGTWPCLLCSLLEHASFLFGWLWDFQMHSPSWWQQCSGVDASQIEVLDFFIFFYSALGYFVYSNIFFSKVSFIKHVFFSCKDLTMLFPQNCTAPQAAKSVIAVDGKFFD